MPSIKPRIAVTLEPSTYAVIERFAELQSKSRAKVVAELLEAVVPALSRTVSLLDAAQRAPREVQEGLVKVITSIEDDLNAATGEAMYLADELEEELSEGNSVRAEDLSNPHLVTRGSGYANPLFSFDSRFSVRGGQK